MYTKVIDGVANIATVILYLLNYEKMANLTSIFNIYHDNIRNFNKIVTSEPVSIKLLNMSQA